MNDIPLYRRDPAHARSARCQACGLRPFARLGAHDAAALARIHPHMADIRVEPGQRVFSAQDPGHAVSTVRGGVVRLERVNETDERRILCLAGRTDLIGPVGARGARIAMPELLAELNAIDAA